MLISDYYEYIEGNIILNVPIPRGLPELIEVSSNILTLKGELHVTLINTSRTAILIDSSRARIIEQEIINAFKQFVTKLPLTKYEISKQLRLVQREENKTVIALAQIQNLKQFFNLLREKYKKDIPDQPTHITIYTLVPSKGIGLNSIEILEQDSQVVEIAELENIKFKF